MSKNPSGPNDNNQNRKKLNKKEIKALNDLKDSEDIVITNADKGGAIVISDVKDYVEEANRQLSNRNHYQKLPNNPTTEHAALVENAIDSLRISGALDENMANKLKPHHPKTHVYISYQRSTNRGIRAARQSAA